MSDVKVPETPVKQMTIVDSTLERINALQSRNELQIPKDYSAPNALKSAWLILQDVKNLNKEPVLTACTKESIANALLNMVVQGLNPMKRQCSFIAYGNKLTLQREYQGSIAIAKRAGLKSVVANAIFEGDDFAFEIAGATGRKSVTKHTQSIDSIGATVKGAYAIVTMDDGQVNVEVMNMKQIMQSWQQGPTKGISPAHRNFPDQMACKTVINRAVKTIINSSDDAALFEDEEPTDNQFTASVKNEIAEKSNKEFIGFEEHVDEPVKPVSFTKQVPEAIADEHGEVMENSKQVKAPF